MGILPRFDKISREKSKNVPVWKPIRARRPLKTYGEYAREWKIDHSPRGFSSMELPAECRLSIAAAV